MDEGTPGTSDEEASCNPTQALEMMSEQMARTRIGFLAVR
jgi:hypothetical protein